MIAEIVLVLAFAAFIGQVYEMLTRHRSQLDNADQDEPHGQAQ